ncbi:rolling circle replication protein, Rep63 protein, partial [Moraxella catarrhalis]|nr:rolling circle replication protein, Rep63 protein [Moraxella catarrhalis]
WGIENEIAKGHTKTGKNGNLTAWDLLKLSMLDDEQAGKLFQEFAICFKGRRQLVWSRGLKAMFGVGEKTDEQLADETEKTSKHVLDLESTLWTLIVRYKSRAYFLELVEKDYQTGTNYAFEFLEELAIIEYKRLLIDDT